MFCILQSAHSKIYVISCHRFIIFVSWQDIEVLDSVSKSLGPLLEFSDMFSAEDYVTLLRLKPVLQLFGNNILQAKTDDTDLTKTIKKTVLDHMTNSYGDYD